MEAQQLVTLLNISSTVPKGKNRVLEKSGALAIQKVAKTGNIGEKSPVAGDIDSM